MKNKKLIPILLSIAYVYFSCSSSNTADMKEAEKQIIKADKSMSQLAAKIGFYRALGEYADKDFVKMTEGSHPIIGKKMFEERYKDDPGSKTLTWEPVEVRVAESGELGYTWGNWKFILPDTVYYGNYVTIWKKNSEGNWKMLYDGGNGTPAPDK
jgi:ketosteroid isomerase-like protein